MGREIRMVPPNWQHPKSIRPNGEVDYQPLCNEPFHKSLTEWLANYNAWRDGTHEDFAEHGAEYPNYWTWASGPPDPEYYRPEWKDGEATWFQVYETVSEGTPVTPPFAKKEELAEYLVANGDFWDQKRRARGGSSMRCDPWTREQAERFVFGAGWAPSLIMAGGSGIQAGHRFEPPKEVA